MTSYRLVETGQKEQEDASLLCSTSQGECLIGRTKYLPPVAVYQAIINLAHVDYLVGSVGQGAWLGSLPWSFLEVAKNVLARTGVSSESLTEEGPAFKLS